MWNNLIITLHYVRDNSKYYCLTTDQHEFLLDWLAERYDFVSLCEMKKSLAANIINLQPLCCLTFDDGLQEHYYNVFHIILLHKSFSHNF